MGEDKRVYHLYRVDSEHFSLLEGERFTYTDVRNRAGYIYSNQAIAGAEEISAIADLSEQVREWIVDCFLEIAIEHQKVNPDQCKEQMKMLDQLEIELAKEKERMEDERK